MRRGLHDVLRASGEERRTRKLGGWGGGKQTYAREILTLGEKKDIRKTEKPAASPLPFTENNERHEGGAELSERLSARRPLVYVSHTATSRGLFVRLTRPMPSEGEEKRVAEMPASPCIDERPSSVGLRVEALRRELRRGFAGEKRGEGSSASLSRQGRSTAASTTSRRPAPARPPTFELGGLEDECPRQGWTACCPGGWLLAPAAPCVLLAAVGQRRRLKRLPRPTNPRPSQPPSPLFAPPALPLL